MVEETDGEDEVIDAGGATDVEVAGAGADGALAVDGSFVARGALSFVVVVERASARGRITTAPTTTSSSAPSTASAPRFDDDGGGDATATAAALVNAVA